MRSIGPICCRCTGFVALTTASNAKCQRVLVLALCPVAILTLSLQTAMNAPIHSASFVHSNGETRIFLHTSDYLFFLPTHFIDLIHHGLGFNSRLKTHLFHESFHCWTKTAFLLHKLLTSRPKTNTCLLYTSPSPRDRTRSRMPSSA